MSHAYSRNYVHLVFGTKGRRPWIPAPLQENLWRYLAGIARQYGIETAAVGGRADHVHLLLCLPPKISVATVVRALKANSSKWMNEQGHLFAWQQGYAAFSVSESNADKVAEYIRGQAEHHKKHAFEDEFRSLLLRNGVKFDERYVLG